MMNIESTIIACAICAIISGLMATALSRDNVLEDCRLTGHSRLYKETIIKCEVVKK